MTTPTGIIAEPLNNLAQMLAQSVAFQAWTGAADATAAAGFIHVIEPDDGAVLHPIAVLSWDRIEWRAIAGGAGQQFIPNGQTAILFEAVVNPSDINLSKNPAYVFTNALGAIIADLLAAAGQSGMLYLQSISIDAPPIRANESYLGTAGDFFQAKITVQWGL